MNNNRIITPQQGLVDPTGRKVTSAEPLPVTFERQKRMVIDRKRNNGSRIDYTTVLCDGCARAWIIDVPIPPNMPSGAPQLCVWGYFSPEGEQTLGHGLTRASAEAQATEFARVTALNEIENQITG